MSLFATLRHEEPFLSQSRRLQEDLHGILLSSGVLLSFTTLTDPQS